VQKDGVYHFITIWFGPRQDIKTYDKKGYFTEVVFYVQYVEERGKGVKRPLEKPGKRLN